MEELRRWAGRRQTGWPRMLAQALPLTSLMAGLLVSAGCADEGDPSKGSGRDATSAAAGDADQDGAGDSAGDGDGADFGNVGDGTPGSAAQPGMPASSSDLPGADCLTDTQEGEQVPVDMYIMLDRSGSMLEPTGAGPTKWDAIRDALTMFVADPGSDGLGVGLQYFPINTPGVPDECFSDDDCGMLGGPCISKGCTPTRANDPNFVLTACLNDLDCPLFSSCLALGRCEDDQSFGCFGPGPDGCQELGACVAEPGSCLFWATCDVAEYADPAVPIGILPGNGMAFTDSLAGAMPFGLTPTSSALAGAINHAAAHGRANPERRVIAVLATDGLPTDCVPFEIAGVAAIAAEGQTLRPSVQTYVIGVFASGDAMAQQNLDQLASAGGSETAFIVDPAQDVAAQFLAALDEIRGGVLQCEYQLPEAPEGISLDFGRVNVTLTEPEQVSDLLYVESPDGCDQAPMAWYYDVPPADGTPTKIQVCDRTCDTLEAARDGRVDIRLGCETKRPD